MLDARIAGATGRRRGLRWRRKHIRAPFDGVVIERLMSVGEAHGEQGPVLVVAMIDPLLVEGTASGCGARQRAAERGTAAAAEDGTETLATVDTADPIRTPPPAPSRCG